MNRILNKVGEYDYDYKNDIFLFKVKNREYSHSIELQNFVIDFDEESFIVGLQIFNASTIFNIPKSKLKQIKNFKLQSKINNGTIQMNLMFNMQIRNQLVQYQPIIFEKIGEDTPNSEIICTA